MASETPANAGAADPAAMLLAPSPLAVRRLTITACAVLALLYVALWVLTTHYQGFGDDAQLYAVQALSRLYPKELGHDVFLQFASQDRYTLFSPIYAFFIGKLGLATSASLLTLVLHATSLATLWSIARRFGDWRLSILALGLAIVIPGSYGAGDTFQYRESFLTARLAAEAAGLIAIALWLHDRRWPAAIAALAAAALHPLVAAPIFALGALSLCRSMKLRTGTLIALLVGAAICITGVLAVTGRLRPISGDWITLLRGRNNYLFPTTWSLSDWGLNVLPLMSLALGAFVLREQHERLFAGALALIGALGFAASTVAGDLFPLEIVTQVQPWRWIWLPKLMSIVLLPATLSALWQDAPARSSAALLALAWIAAPLGGVAIIAVTIGLWLGRRAIPARTAMLATGAIAIGVAMNLAFFALAIFSVSSTRMLDSWLVERVVDLSSNAGLMVLLVGACWFFTIMRPTAAGAVLVAALAVATLANRGPAAWFDWTADPYSPAAREEFAAWREVIPPDANVLWVDNPAASWFLLNRATYVSQTQSAGIVFSEETAAEIHRRALAIQAMADPRWLLYFGRDMRPDEEGIHPLTLPILQSVCADAAVGFVVSRENVGGSVATRGQRGPWDNLHLYSCANVRAHNG